MGRTLLWALLLGCLSVLVWADSLGTQSPWGFVTSLIGPNLLLDDGSLVRLGPNTRFTRPDGSAGTREDVVRQAKAALTYAADGTVAQVCVFPPRSAAEVYLSNLTPLRGSAGVMPTKVGEEVYSRSLALSRTTYARAWNWAEFRSGIRYDPRGVAAAPGAARFMLRDTFGDLIVERVLSAGQSGRIDLGLDNQVPERLTLEAASAGEGPVQREWCLWLDPHFVVASPPPPGSTLSPRTADRLVEALAKAAGNRRIERLAVADFGTVRVSADQWFPREFTEELFALLGRRYRMAGTFRRRLEVGAPLTDSDRAELGKIGAAYVLTGCVSARSDGRLVNAAVVQVDNGAFVAAAGVRE